MNAMSDIRAPIDYDFRPSTPDELRLCLLDPMWRLCSGYLYKIMIKDEVSGDLLGVVPFKPNAMQMHLFQNMHYRNVILKARQLGGTTAIAICWTDHAAFVPNQRCGIIAHNLTAAETIFRDKVKFAYDNLPEAIRAEMPLVTNSADEILFGHNNSSIRVATSMRSGTVHRLHISEMGKIAKERPAHAREIVTGSLPAVPLTGVAVIESTSEGPDGEFYKIARKAEDNAAEKRDLAPSEWAFHFFAWFTDPKYVTDPARIKISPTEHQYFDRIEREMDVDLSLAQRAWYIAKRDNDFSGDAEKMWQEMPSTPGECWQKSTEGTWFGRQMAAVRAQGRIGQVPLIKNVPVHTFWDIGNSDGTAIWFMQHTGTQKRWINFFEGWGESYDYFVKRMRDTGYLFGIHYLPHDATHKRQMARTIAAPLDMLQELAPDWRWHIVPRVQDLIHGIELTRASFAESWFDAENCKEGLVHLSQYKKMWSTTQGVFIDTPNKVDGHSEAADAFRQHAQGFDPRHMVDTSSSSKKRTRPGALII